MYLFTPDTKGTFYIGKCIYHEFNYHVNTGLSTPLMCDAFTGP